jgi:hypothetical protein
MGWKVLRYVSNMAVPRPRLLYKYISAESTKKLLSPKTKELICLFVFARPHN